MNTSVFLREYIKMETFQYIGLLQYLVDGIDLRQILVNACPKSLFGQRKLNSNSILANRKKQLSFDRSN